MENKFLILILVIVVAITVGYVYVSSQNTSFTGFAVTSPIKTCKNVQVPYQTQEEYQVPLKFEVTSATKDTTLNGFDVWAVGEVVVRNVDSETGKFTVVQTFATLNGPKKTLQSSQYVMPGESKTFHEEYNVDFGEDFNVEYNVRPPSKTMTRTVTKYRTEERCS